MECKECNEEAGFFHSGCCNAHFEGIITKEGKKQIACEKCGKIMGELKE